MNELGKEYIKELVRLNITQETLDRTRKVLAECGDVADTLANPLVTQDEKRNIIKKIFPENMHKFFIKAVKDGNVENLGEIFEE